MSKKLIIQAIAEQARTQKDKSGTIFGAVITEAAIKENEKLFNYTGAKKLIISAVKIIEQVEIKKGELHILKRESESMRKLNGEGFVFPFNLEDFASNAKKQFVIKQKIKKLEISLELLIDKL